MHIFILEFKRLWKVRLTWIVGITILLLTALYAYAMVNNAYYSYTDSAGKTTTLHGIKAINKNKDMYNSFNGKVTNEVLQNDLKVYQQINNQYNGNEPYSVYSENILPRISRLYGLTAIYTGSSEDISVLMKLNPSQLTDVYGKRNELLEKTLKEAYPDNRNIQEQALSQNNKIPVPFYYEYGISQNIVGSIGLIVFILILGSVIINSSIFSGSYQTGADAIFRTTKFGRRKLALSKLFASLSVDGIIYIVCIAVFTLIVNIAFGWNGLKTSEQISSILSILPLSLGQKEIVLIVGGFISLIAVSCFTMFLSSICKSPVSSLIMGVVFCFLPALLFGLAQGNMRSPISILSDLLPAGGIGFNNGLSFQLDSLAFFSVSTFGVWIPYLTIGAALIEIPIFFLLAMSRYCKHQTT